MLTGDIVSNGSSPRKMFTVGLLNCMFFHIFFKVSNTLEMWTAGKVKAQRHKVNVFTDKRAEKQRWSVAYFFCADNLTPMAPIDGGIYNENSHLTWEEYIMKTLNYAAEIREKDKLND